MFAKQANPSRYKEIYFLGLLFHVTLIAMELWVFEEKIMLF